MYLNWEMKSFIKSAGVLCHSSDRSYSSYCVCDSFTLCLVNAHCFIRCKILLPWASSAYYTTFLQNRTTLVECSYFIIFSHTCCKLQSNILYICLVIYFFTHLRFKFSSTLESSNFSLQYHYTYKRIAKSSPTM